MHEELWSDITTSEITSSLKGVSGAAGPDRISWREVKDIAPARIAALFNLWMRTEKLPTSLKLGRTTLIPKGARSEGPREVQAGDGYQLPGTVIPQDLGKAV